MTRVFLVLLVGLCQCREQSDDRERRLTRLLDKAEAQTRELADTDTAARRLMAEWSDLDRRFQAASLHYHATQIALERAAQAYTQTSSDYRQASAEANGAARLWRLYRELVLVAAAVDAAKLRSARAHADCGRDMSTADYRDLLIRQGVSVAGMDVDHIVPRSLGGADHPDNYQLLPSSENRSIGNDWGEGKCAAVGAERCGRAVRASNECGSLRGTGF